jgi:hypothetical protein
MSDRARCIARNTVKPADLVSGALVQAPLIGVLARLGAKSHAPIASSGETEFSAAMVAAHGHELRLHTLGLGARNPIAATELLKATL